MYSPILNTVEFQENTIEHNIAGLITEISVKLRDSSEAHG